MHRDWKIAFFSGGIAILAAVITILPRPITEPLAIPTSTSVPTLTHTPIPTLTHTLVPTLTHTLVPTFEPTPTPNPIEVALQEWSNSSQTNNDWTPIEKREADSVLMMLVPPGKFVMGSSDAELEIVVSMCSQSVDDAEECDHDGYIDEVSDIDNTQEFVNPFWIDKFEVTRGQYLVCVSEGECDDTPASAFSDDDDQPINRVTWLQADKFCEWRDARLPTEAEWEFAAGGPDSLRFPWGNNFDRDKVVGAGDEIYWGRTAPVNVRPSGQSWVGALHMSGNVWEWTASLFRPYPYKSTDNNDPDNSYDQRVFRGGSIANLISALRVSNRGGARPTFEGHYWGFRCARDYEF